MRGMRLSGRGALPSAAPSPVPGALPGTLCKKGANNFLNRGFSMTRYFLSFISAATLAACAPPITGPAPLRIPEPQAVPAPPAPLPGAPSEAAVANPGRMVADCRAAAARQFNLPSEGLSLSPAEETSLGFVVFGQASGAARSFECSFGPDGALRVVRAA